MIRKIHLYLGTLFAPTIIFFAFTGALQTLGWHEAEETNGPQPPAWIVKLASLHKDQRLPGQQHKKMPAPLEAMRAEQAAADHHAADAHAEDAADDPKANGQAVLKIFVLMMAAGLIASAVLGIGIALRNPRTRRVALLMLLAGVLLPAGMLLL